MRSKPDDYDKTMAETQLAAMRGLTLELLSVEGRPVASYPIAVIDNLRHLVMRLSIDGQFPKSLALSSALRGEGVTYQTFALATTLAHDTSANVGIVDLNWWWPPSRPFFPADNGGLAAVISGKKELDQVLIPTGWLNLSFVPAGNLKILDRSKASRGGKLKEIVQALSQRFDHLILDIPAILSTSDSIPLVALAEGCCLVIRQGVTPVEDVRSALDSISNLQVLGVILNQAKLATPEKLIKLILQTLPGEYRAGP